ncbi:transcriptional regulator SplA domain-containing protein, partial [Desertibacillus haloalkaliphilus]|uniref:transcriptional regulator SplA domain-containing protein n=1 Tax=Desertibacillus haloalkaliphilus TaxID=1328930 RepID=UPI0024847B3F
MNREQVWRAKQQKKRPAKLDIQQLEEGQQVYIIYRNPHTQTVSNVQEATIARDPMDPSRLS